MANVEVEPFPLLIEAGNKVWPEMPWKSAFALPMFTWAPSSLRARVRSLALVLRTCTTNPKVPSPEISAMIEFVEV